MYVCIYVCIYVFMRVYEYSRRFTVCPSLPRQWHPPWQSERSFPLRRPSPASRRSGSTTTPHGRGKKANIVCQTIFSLHTRLLTNSKSDQPCSGRTKERRTPPARLWSPGRGRRSCLPSGWSLRRKEVSLS